MLRDKNPFCWHKFNTINRSRSDEISRLGKGSRVAALHRPPILRGPWLAVLMSLLIVLLFVDDMAIKREIVLASAGLSPFDFMRSKDDETGCMVSWCSPVERKSQIEIMALLLFNYLTSQVNFHMASRPMIHIGRQQAANNLLILQSLNGAGEFAAKGYLGDNLI